MKGITVLGGVIDSNYRKEVKCILLNTADQDFKVEKGQCICQGVLLPTLTADFREVEELKNDDLHTGFGSTGTN